MALSISYFNAVACAWEPAVEKFTLKLDNQVAIMKTEYSMKIKENLCINVSESLLKTLADTSKSFEETN